MQAKTRELGNVWGIIQAVRGIAFCHPRREIKNFPFDEFSDLSKPVEGG